MAIHVFNTLTRQREEFVPHQAPQVKMYCCGPTVYGLLHVGNFRGPIFYNFMRNWLEERGYQVKLVYNYTDVDDKIIRRAEEEKTSAAEISQKYIREFETDFRRLKLRPHDLNPTVTESMDEIRGMVSELIAKGHAYVSPGTEEGQDVNFSIRSFQPYGKLSNRNPEDMRAGVRIEANEKKQDPLDFALWKAAKPGEPSWDSDWGKGRPGWHIECSAMIRRHLGDVIDIHGGGLDLVFPHHENEIAQSECATGKTLAKYWLHNNMLNLGGSKMSKSLGNIQSGRDFMDQNGPEVFKYMMLSVHYRSVLDLSPEAIDLAVAALARIYSALNLATWVKEQAARDNIQAQCPADFQQSLDEAWQKAGEAFDEDFNTAEGLARLFEVIRLFNSKIRRGMKINAAGAGMSQAFLEYVGKYGRIMSIFAESPGEFLREMDDRLLAKMQVKREDVDRLVAERSEARKQKDFAKSDELRKRLSDLKINVQDTAEGSDWEVMK